ncbi:MAG: MoaD/ThiS family protein [Rhodothermales bacterium]|nr:MoaD/ThiS family protein [Rhodothermales bacterium]
MSRAHFTIKIFSVLQDRLGTDALEIEQESSLSVRDLVDEACKQYPKLEAYRSFFRVAVNLEYAQDDDRVSADDEVAILMPASGG